MSIIVRKVFLPVVIHGSNLEELHGNRKQHEATGLIFEQNGEVLFVLDQQIDDRLAPISLLSSFARQLLFLTFLFVYGHELLSNAPGILGLRFLDTHVVYGHVVLLLFLQILKLGDLLDVRSGELN